MDQTNMMDFVDKAVDDVAALLGGAMVAIGDNSAFTRPWPVRAWSPAPSWPDSQKPPSTSLWKPDRRTERSTSVIHTDHRSRYYPPR